MTRVVIWDIGEVLTDVDGDDVVTPREEVEGTLLLLEELVEVDVIELADLAECALAGEKCASMEKSLSVSEIHSRHSF